MISCKASECPELYVIATLIAALTNPQCHRDLKEMPDAERLAELEIYKSKFLEIVG